jgi:TatD DNase family protein
VRLVDSHAHLQAPAFEADAREVLAAARLAGVERLLSPGWDPASSRAGFELAAAVSGVDTSAGVHPHDAAKVGDAGWAEIVALASEDAVVAIGETGLDYDRMFSPREAQLTNLRRHLVLARDLAKPLILHCRSSSGARDAQDDLLSELKGAGVGGSSWAADFGTRPPGVLHSFSGPVDYAKSALDLGCAVSFSGLVFRRGEEASAEVARLVPVERLLVETDSPYLSPPGAPRNRNEPEWVAVTARWVAQQRDVDLQTLGDALVAAYDRTFSRARAISDPLAPTRR